MTLKEIKDIKDSISGVNFKNHTKESLIKLNEDLYNDNYLGNLDLKTKIQIKNLLIKRLNEDLLDIEIAEKTGYGEEKIESLVNEMMDIIQSSLGISEMESDSYHKSHKFLSDVTRFSIRSDYKNDKTDNKIYFMSSMKNIVFRTAIVDIKYRNICV